MIVESVQRNVSAANVRPGAGREAGWLIGMQDLSGLFAKYLPFRDKLVNNYSQEMGGTRKTKNGYA